MLSVLFAAATAGVSAWILDLSWQHDQMAILLVYTGWYFYLRIGDRLDALTIAVESLQDALQRIEAKNDTVPSKNSGDQNESVSIAGNRHCTTREQ